jgi:hypothetical protein
LQGTTTTYLGTYVYPYSKVEILKFMAGLPLANVHLPLWLLGHALMNGLHIYLGLSHFNATRKLHLMDRNM